MEEEERHRRLEQESKQAAEELKKQEEERLKKMTDEEEERKKLEAEKVEKAVGVLLTHLFIAKICWPEDFVLFFMGSSFECRSEINSEKLLESATISKGFLN